MPLLDARWWEINLGLSFKVEFGKGQLVKKQKSYENTSFSMERVAKLETLS